MTFDDTTISHERAMTSWTRGSHDEREETMLANVSPQQTWWLTRARGSARQVRGLWQARGDGKADERQWFGGSCRQWAVWDGGGR